MRNLLEILEKADDWKMEISNVQGLTQVIITAFVPQISLVPKYVPVEAAMPSSEPNITVPSAASPPIPHPGIYLESMLIGANITKKELQDSLQLTPSYVNDMLNGQRDITVDAAVRLETHFKKLKRTADFWVQMQAQYNLQERRKKRDMPTV